MLDTIFIENLPTQAIIGIHAFEKAAPQKLLVSVELGTDTRRAAATDDVNYALDYHAISHFIDDFVNNSSCELLETLAENLVAALFAEFSAHSLETITLTVQKPGAISYTRQVGIKIHRQRR